MITFNNKTLLITGGTGSFGNAVLNRFLKTDIGEIRIFSRDEKKQDDMRHEFQVKMPEVADKIKFYIGDLQNGYFELSALFKNFHIDDSALGEIIASEVAFAEKKFYFSYIMGDLKERHFAFDEICSIKFKKISSKMYSSC